MIHANPPFTLLATNVSWPAWLNMWLLAIGIYAALKLLTWMEARPWKVPAWRLAAYLVAWPGMDARAFLFGAASSKPTSGEWLLAVGKFALGLALLAGAAANRFNVSPPWRAWLGMTGLVFTLHFGVFHVLSCAWRRLGIAATPIMNWPIASRSVSEFWGRRWNLAFRDLTHRFVFRPLLPRYGATAALLIGFLLSGLVHDAVISVPAGAGYGWPTLFFVLQGIAILVERSHWGQAAGLGRGLRGWLFAALVVLLPVPLLFHEPFQERVVLPFLDFLGWLFVPPPIAELQP